MLLPNDITYGYVVGRYLLAIGDTLIDEDHLPEARAAFGTVKFTPLATNIISSVAPPVTILPQPVTGSINSDGFVYDETGNIGVWLVAGQYTVSFAFQSVALPSFVISVTAAHTLAAPLDLSLNAALVPSPATIFVVNQQIYNDSLAASTTASAAAATAVAAAAAVPKWWSGTQAQYNAIGVKEADRLYLITTT